MANSRQKRAQQMGRKKSKGTLSANAGTMTSTATQAKVPRAVTTYKDNTLSVVLRNTEVLSTVWPITTGTFGALGKYINPVSLFGWGANIAVNFSQFRFRKLQFRYVPIVGTTQTGYFAMAFVSDPEDVTEFGNLTVDNALSRIANSKRYVQVPAWESATLVVRPEDFELPYYFIEGDNITDAGTARLATAGGLYQVAQSTSTAATGIVYVDYEMELRNPVNKNLNK